MKKTMNKVVEMKDLTKISKLIEQNSKINFQKLKKAIFSFLNLDQ